MVTLAAQAALAANRPVIRTLRLVGARDGFIARAFARRLTARAAGGALAGTAAAMLALALLPQASEQGFFLVGVGLAGWRLAAAAGDPAGAPGLVAWSPAAGHAALPAALELKGGRRCYWLRSLVFVALMYLLMAVIGILGRPGALVGRRRLPGDQAYCRVVFWLLRVLCGSATVEIRGTVPDGEVLVAAKHQSFFDIMMIWDGAAAAEVHHEVGAALGAGPRALRAAQRLHPVDARRAGTGDRADGGGGRGRAGRAAASW